MKMNEMQAATATGAEVLVQHLKARGVRRIYGVPGGDCSLDVIGAAEQAGIPFALARTENSAAIMAAVEAELTGTLGVVLTTRGPGVTNCANGMAYAALDRAPLLLIGDAYENNLSFVSHQRFDQVRVLDALVKGSLRLDEPTALPGIGPLLDQAMATPRGAVYMEITGNSMRGSVPRHAVSVQPARTLPPEPAAASIDAARALLGAARRPVIVAGLQAAEADATAALRALAERLDCPVFTTYKAKGVLADSDARMTGFYIGGAAEEATLRAADLLIGFGVDPVEFPPQPWKYSVPVLELTNHPFVRNYVTPTVLLVGDLAATAGALQDAARPSEWGAQALAAAKRHMRAAADALGGEGISPEMLVQAGCDLAPAGSRVTVDAGVHMLSVMAIYQARAPRELLISRGLATMAFALPAAIGAAMADPARHVVAFTGDGGLMMCAAELATAVQCGCKLTVVVLNDSAITMIGLKQRKRGLPRQGMDYSPSDFAKVAEGFGCPGWRVERPDQLRETLARAYAVPGTTVVDVVIDPAPYEQQLRLLRG